LRNFLNIKKKRSFYRILYNNFNLIEQSCSSFTARYFSKNQNAIGHHHSQNEDISLSNKKENQELLNTSSPSTNFTTINPVELQINANDKPES
jgi:hypothetical protein